MAKYVREIMNPELFSVEPEASRKDTLDFLLLLGVTACPVIDEAGTVLGIVGVPDLISDTGGDHTRDRISGAAVTVVDSATVNEAALKLSQHHVHRLIVVDADGRAVGIVSAVDLVSALVGQPVTHPTGFPNLDTSGKVSWSGDQLLEPENAAQVPNEPGVLVLVYGGAGREEVPVWVEDVQNLRARADDLVAGPPPDNAALANILNRDHGHLRFRTAVIPDAALRSDTVFRVQRHLRPRLWSKGA